MDQLINAHGLRKVIFWLFALTLLIGISTHIVRTVINIKGNTVHAIFIGFLAWLLAFFFRFGFNNTHPKSGKIYWPRLSIPIILTVFWAANNDLFGLFDVSAAIFHLQNGVEYKGLQGDIFTFWIYLTLGAFAIASLSYLARRDIRLKKIETFMALPLLLINPVTLYAFDRISSQIWEPIDLTAHYVESKPQYIQSKALADNARKNLLLIYVESVEDTFRHESFGDAFDPFRRIERRGVRLNGVHEVQDTGWTIAGITASQCGVPALSYGLIRKNRMSSLESFLPGAHCLGTVLSGQGYETVFMGGGDLAFAGKRRFFNTHGYKEIWGTSDYPKQAQGPLVKWGILDDVLFDFAFEKLRELESKDKPYLFSMLTLSAHGPAGFPAPRCENYTELTQHEDTVLKAVSCTGLLIEHFLEKAEEEGLLKDTVIVILNDHLGHKHTQKKNLKALNRQNFTTILNSELSPAIRDVNGSMIDMYPTLLELTGLTLPENRQGLGVSLLSSEPSLLSQYGLKSLNKAITLDNKLRAKLWAIGDGVSKP